jgi:nitrite reductase/ring-hydroxylating ferredoxin subunit
MKEPVDFVTKGPMPGSLDKQFGDWIHVSTLAELQATGCQVVHGADRPIAVFFHNSSVYAVDNRCPHLGFPLNKGTVQDGILTCHWHQARFDLCSGCTFDLWADDVLPFETRIDGGAVLVRSLPRHDPGRNKRQLLKGLSQNIELLQAKGLVSMLAEKAEPLALIREILGFGVERMTSGQGLTELAIGANLAADFGPETLYHMLLRGSREIAQASSSSRRPTREALAGDDYSFDTLERWFNQWILLRDEEAANRVLLTAIKINATPRQLADMLFGSISQRIYSQLGHPFDLLNKSMELLDHVGWDFADRVLPLVVPAMIGGRGAEEDVRWHHPINLIELVRGAEGRLADAMRLGQSRTWKPGTDIAGILLGEDPAAIINVLMQSLDGGAPPSEISKHLAYAAALRLAQFSSGNEVGDWFNPQHTFSFANAVDQAIRRSPTPMVVRSVFHVAMSVYLDRFLNIPPAHLPAAENLAALPADATALLGKLSEALDGRSNLQTGARLVARYLSLDHSISRLIDSLAELTLREDLDFHTLQVLEAGARQARHWPGKPEAANIYIGVIRNLAAVCPTPRARLKTATTALRLHSGQQVYLGE